MTCEVFINANELTTCDYNRSGLGSQNTWRKRAEIDASADTGDSGARAGTGELFRESAFSMTQKRVNSSAHFTA